MKDFFKNSFLDGFFSAFDLSPPPTRKENSNKSGFEKDFENINKDFKNIGNDIKKSIKTYKNKN